MSRTRAGWRQSDRAIRGRPLSEIDRRWIVANLIVSIAFGILGVLDDPLRKSLGVEIAGAASNAKPAYIVIIGIAATFCFTLYGWLIGRVLRLIVPALPWRQWVAAHAAIGLLSAFSFDTPWRGFITEAVAWYQEGPAVRALVVVPGLVVIHGILGAAVAVVQALVLRSSADGMRIWITVSFLAASCMFLFVVPVWLLLPSGTIASDAVFHSAVFAGSMAEAFVMLPAVRRLRPRAA